jgi:histidine ammonia-lyase
MHMLELAWTDLMLLIERMCISFHVGEVSHLPHGLIKPGSDVMGTTGQTAWIAGGLLEEARVCASSGVFIPGSAHDSQNDTASPTFIAYKKERRVAELFDDAIALLAVAASQALWVTDREPAPPLRDLLATIQAVFPPVEEWGGRALGHEAAKVADLLHEAALTGELSAAAVTA